MQFAQELFTKTVGYVGVIGKYLKRVGEQQQHVVRPTELIL